MMIFLLISRYENKKKLVYFDKYYSNIIRNLVLNRFLDDNVNINVKYADSHKIKGLQIADFVASGFRAKLAGKESFVDIISDLFEENKEESQDLERFAKTMIGIML